MRRLVTAAAALLALSAAIRLGVARAGEHRDRSDAASSVEYVGTLLVQLRVSDLERSVVFYRDILGLKLEERNDALRWVRFETGIKGVTIGIGEGRDAKGSGTASINLGVADLDRARRLLETKGVNFTGETTTVPDVVKLADLTDPDGNRIRLAQSLKRPK